MAIGPFEGEWMWLSNSSPNPVGFKGKMYPTVEHAFQAAKTTNEADRLLVHRAKSPEWARRLGRTIQLRADWESIKFGVMEGLLRQKFQRKGFLLAKLRDTHPHELIAINTSSDTIWGVCNGQGENRLGKLLMRLRLDIRVEQGLSL